MNTPLQPRVGIIGGKGIMGSQFAEWFSRHGASVDISDKGTKMTNAYIAKSCDIVCIAVPMDVMEKVIRDIVPHLKKNGLICDLTSVKEMPCRLMSAHEGEVMGMHPMFGKVATMKGKVVVTCPIRTGRWTQWLRRAMETDGMLVKKMTPHKHDAAMAVVQGFVHAADIAFMHTLRDLKIPIREMIPIASLASEMKIAFAARLIAQDARLYANIQIAQKQNAVILEKFRENIAGMIRDIRRCDRAHAETFFNEAKHYAGRYAIEALAATNEILERIAESRKSAKKSHNNENRREEERKKTSKKTAWGVFGGTGSYTDQAFQCICPQEKDLSFYQSIPHLLRMVKKGNIHTALVPAENSTFGTIRETLDTIAREKLYITGAWTMPIHHYLYVAAGKKHHTIQTIASHEQALKQCEDFLEKHYPNATHLKVSSTAEAMERLRITSDPTLAVIAQKKYTTDPQYACLHRNIEDMPNNITIFYGVSASKSDKINVIPKATVTEKKHHGWKKRTSIVFDFKQDRSGNLEKALHIFAKNNVNLARIESRPNPKKVGQYFFFVDAEENEKEQQGNDTITKALTELRPLVRFFHEMGRYEVISL